MTTTPRRIREPSPWLSPVGDTPVVFLLPLPPPPSLPPCDELGKAKELSEGPRCCDEPEAPEAEAADTLGAPAVLKRECGDMALIQARALH